MMLREKEFTSAEHRYLGNVKLGGLNSDFSKFELPGGAKLTFGEIILLSGDYFGVNLLPISLGATEQQRQTRFLESFSKLANCHPDKVYRITEHVSDADTAVDFILKDIDGSYLLLAQHNIDHFNDYAVVAFKTGYTLAMNAAVEAAMLINPDAQQKKLQYAYSLLAFASHFLTDNFATGHMRTPRLELDQMFSPEIGSMLSYFQHNEDGDLGLEVKSASLDNPTATTWVAYGDGHLLEEKNSECKKRAFDAVQVAVNEVFSAYINKKATPVDQSLVMTLLPVMTGNNHPPMFKVDRDGNLLCRIPIGGEPQDQYAELSRMKLMEIFAYYAQQYLHSAIRNQIDYVIKLFQEKKNDFYQGYTSLRNYSFFSNNHAKSDAIELENKNEKNDLRL